jgi:serine/threonine-protein kinase RsbW
MQRKILIIDDHDDLASSLQEVFTHVGHTVQVVANGHSIPSGDKLKDFDLIVTDLDVQGSTLTPKLNGNGTQQRCLPREVRQHVGERTKAFKVCAAGLRNSGFDEDELKSLVATILDYKIRFVDTDHSVQDLHEYIEFELPSALSLMHIVLEYLLKRVEKLGVVKCEQSNLFVALDEAFVNAIKHGNKFDSSKLVRITAEVSKQEARFIIEDEGEGFDVDSIADPLDPANLFKTSGRGVLFIYNIMDEVKYNERGNRLTMVKRCETATE